MPPASKRRWFRFSLRGFVVVTILGIAVGWNLHVVRLRREALFSYVKRGAGFDLDQHHEPHVPLIRGLQGDWPAVFDIELPSDVFTAEERERLQSLFPEVRVALVNGSPMSVPSKEEIEYAKSRAPSIRAPISMYRLGQSETAINLLIAIAAAVIWLRAQISPTRNRRIGGFRPATHP